MRYILIDPYSGFVFADSENLFADSAEELMVAWYLDVRNHTSETTMEVWQIDGALLPFDYDGQDQGLIERVQAEGKRTGMLTMEVTQDWDQGATVYTFDSGVTITDSGQERVIKTN